MVRRLALLCALAGCANNIDAGGAAVVEPVAPGEAAPAPTESAAPTSDDEPASLGALDNRYTDFAFEGGEIDFELYRDGIHVAQVARNRYAVPVTLHWQMTELDNLEPVTAIEGAITLPAATGPMGVGEPIVLARFHQIDPRHPYHRQLYMHARFGDPAARPTQYSYRVPYPRGQVYAVLQGFHGAFSHRGSNEFAVDFDCPVATPVLAARDGIVVATHDSAQGAGTTPEYQDLTRVNFVYILHDDGTLGEYMHLAPSGVSVAPGQHVERGQQIALSGFTGFSSTPHLHFQVMTSAPDGIAAHSFPWHLRTGPHLSVTPEQGRRYASWE
ncbi:MAG TPA: M23 family metallopeptidase [Kofleriaceae bacterium]